MSLESRLSLLATAIAAEINQVRSEMGGGGVSVAIDDAIPTGNENFWYQASKGIFNIKVDSQWVETSRAGTDGTDGADGADGASGSPTGTISMWATSTPPAAHLLCDGSAVSRSTYSALFVVLGTIYGVGDGSTTFNLPNLKGRVPVGLDSAQTGFDALGETGGAKTHQLTVDEMPSHTHQLMGDNDTSPDGGDAIGTDDTSDTNLEAAACGATGGDQAHNNLQPYIVMSYIIKT